MGRDMPFPSRRRRMHQTLRWHRVGVEENLAALRDGLARKAAALPDGREQALTARWLSSVEEILRQIGSVRLVVMPAVERDLGFSIENDEIFLLALFQPSTKNLFSEINAHFRDGRCALSPTALAEMARLPEAAETLAWIGDAALKIGVLPQIWSPRLADAGLLSERRKAYESNVNMARLCDRWGLYEHRVHFDPPVEKGDCDHVKGTLVEAVLGIVFLQCGLKGVARAARLLAPR
ncbi:ribonuclease III [Methanofollis liminatans DSM 4140]|uniref:Ribonuclease III n=2 Tax=Methanofollis liminatans TaxID=2201 RepID=J1KZA8_9EURY|nr:ribonuclease III [Methanofollis liminatans DSM 4140]